ncbi:hypothetical protein K439DRAFT_1367303 [Ramaria rubella]|nr:hypothetical protein K439DRAFT_1367303 [Ramaria rubella]
MITSGSLSRQPQHNVWTRKKLIHMHAYALGHTLAPSTNITYSSALNSYLNFCKIHDFPVNPTEDSLSFFTVYMCYHIKPTSVDSYLSGIQSQLETYFPNIRQVRRSHLITKTFQVKRKRPLEPEDIALLSRTYGDSHFHDDLLFLAQVTSGFLALNRLGELVWPDTKRLQTYRIVPMRHTVRWLNDTYSYFLPGHKGDRFFEALAGVPNDCIQATGRWSSDAFEAYIHKNPILLQALIWGRPVLQNIQATS